MALIMKSALEQHGFTLNVRLLLRFCGPACGPWFRRADAFRRVTTPSRFGDWSFEVYNCKLSRDTKAAMVLRLSFYSDRLCIDQGMLPEYMHVVMPGDEFSIESHRVLDYAAYYRFLRGQLESCVSQPPGILGTYPDRMRNREICRWWQELIRPASRPSSQPRCRDHSGATEATA